MGYSDELRDTRTDPGARYLVTLAASAIRFLRNVSRSNAPGWAFVHESGPMMTHQVGLFDHFSSCIPPSFPGPATYKR